MPEVIVLQCIDNMFYSLDEDGCLNLPRKHDGKYHIEGGLRVASREQVTNMVKYLEQLVCSTPAAEVILVTSFPRYCLEGQHCCSEPSHLTNKGPELLRSTVKELERVRSQLKTALEKHRVRLLDPTAVLDVGDPATYRAPCHLSLDSTRRLAEQVRTMIAARGGSNMPPQNQSVAVPKRSSNSGSRNSRGSRGGSWSSRGGAGWGREKGGPYMGHRSYRLY